MKFEQSERERIARAFHGRLLEYMAETGKGNRQLATFFGIPVSTLETWMGERATPNARMLANLAEKSGKTCGWWLGLE